MRPQRSPLKHLRRELKAIELKWKSEQGRKCAKKNDGINFIDGVVFGLGIAIRAVDKYWKEVALVLLISMGAAGCKSFSSNDIMYGDVINHREGR